jgi:co-chaperonin GroES (HSP10)
MTNILPLGGLILVKKNEVQDTKTQSGLILTASSLDSELQRGVIVKVGPGERDQNGVTHQIPLDEGQTVIYAENHGTEVTDSNGDKYEFVNWRNLFGREANA